MRRNTVKGKLDYLWMHEEANHPAEGTVVELASNGEFVCMSYGRGRRNSVLDFGAPSVWLPLEEVQILSLLEDNELRVAREHGFVKLKPKPKRSRGENPPIESELDGNKPWHDHNDGVN